MTRIGRSWLIGKVPAGSSHPYITYKIFALRGQSSGLIIVPQNSQATVIMPRAGVGTGAKQFGHWLGNF